MALPKRGRGRPRKVIVETIPTEDLHSDDYLPENEPVNPDLDIAEVSDGLENEDIIAILSSPDVIGATCKLYRTNPFTLKQEYLTTMPAKTFAIENVKQTYGGGDYLMAVQRANGKETIRRTFSIDARFKGSLDIPPAHELGDSKGLNGEKGLTAISMQLANMLNNKFEEMKRTEKDDTMPLLLQQMRDSSQMQMAMLTEFAKSMKPSSDMTSMLIALAPIILEFVRASKKEGSSLTELIGAMVQLRDLTGNEGGEPRDKSLMDKILEGVMPALAPALVPALMNHAQKNNMIPLPAPPSSSPMPVKPNLPKASKPQIKPQPQPEKLEKNNIPAKPQTMAKPSLLLAVLPHLLKGAQNDTDPESFYDMANNMLTDEQMVDLTVILEKDNWRAILFGEQAILTEPHKAWFEELRECFLNEGEPEETSEEIAEGGETKNVDSNANPDPKIKSELPHQQH